MSVRSIVRVLSLAVVIWPPLVRCATESYQIDPAKSSVTIEVGKAGAFSFIAGHTHEVAGPIAGGTIDVDRQNASASRVHLVIATSSLKVSPKGEPHDDRAKVQQTMESDQVLDIVRYPELKFDRTSVSETGHEQSSMDLRITGDLTIRDATHSISVPVRVELGERMITATGQFSIKQTTYGIKPITVGGVVAVKDALVICFSIVARR